MDINLNRDIIIDIDLNNGKIDKPYNASYYNTDSNIAFFYVKLHKMNAFDFTEYISKEDAGNYKVVMKIVKPKTLIVTELIGTISDDLDEDCAIYKFIIKDELMNEVGEPFCYISIYYNNQELVTNGFNYTIKQDPLGKYNLVLLNDPDMPLLKSLLEEIKNNVGGIDDENVRDDKSFSSYKTTQIANNLSSQIKDKANTNDVRMKNINITLNDCDSNMLGAIQGGSDTQFNLLSVPRDNSVTPEKTTFIKCSANQFNKNTVTKNVYIDSIGGIVEDYRYAITDYILVAGKNKLSVYGFYAISYFDSNKNFLNRITLSSSEDAQEGITIPENAGYIRCTYDLNNNVNRQINLSSTLLPYDEFKQTLSENIIVKTLSKDTTLNIKDKSITPEKATFMECSANKFNEKTVTKNVYIDTSGEIVQDERYAITDYIFVGGKDKLSLRGFYAISCFNNNKRFLNRIALSSSEETYEGIVIPENTEYIRCTYDLNNNVNRQINLSSTLLAYDEFKQTLSKDITLTINDKSVTPDRTTFIECSANKFNEQTITKNVYIDASGGIVEDERYAITDYICVVGRDKLSVYGFYAISYFDSNKNFLNRTVLSLSEETYEGMVVPENAEYIRCTYQLDNNVNRQINLSSTLLPYDKFKQTLSENIIVNSKDNILNGKTLLSFGDSITFGYGNNGISYVDYIAENNNMVKINKAISGASFTLCSDRSHILEQMTQMTSQKADYIIFNGLTNDVSSSPDWGTISEGYDGPFDVNTFCGGFESCCSLLKNNWIDSKILFVAVHKMCSRDTGGQERLQALAKEMCNKWSIPYVDLYNEGLNTYLTSMKDRFTANESGVPDGTHPNALGYKTFYVNAIESKLKNI